MPKKGEDIVYNETILHKSMEEVLHESMMPYAEYVILERALPRVEDGLKPVQRRILYAMHELSLTPDKPHRKCARIVGDCLGKYHPHGDTSVYDAMVRMAQPFNMRVPLVDGHGNFGSVDGDTAAAMRYTEARMTLPATLLLQDIDKDTVPFSLNFDDTLKEPDVLPGRFPSLLVNGATGIAVGLATNIPPHNLGETIDAVVALIDDPAVTTPQLMAVLPGPDFPTGGILYGTEELQRAYETGRGKLQVRAKVAVEDGSGGKKLLVVTELPYQVGKAAMLEKIHRLSKEKKGPLAAITDIRDESDRTGMRAVIELRRDSDPDKVLAWLYKYADLQVTFGVNMVAIADGKPALLPLKSMLEHFVQHQRRVVTRRTQFDLDAARQRAHILEGLIIAIDNIDEVIAIIRGSKSTAVAKPRLMERFGLSEAQAQAILDMRLGRLTGLEVIALRDELRRVLELIDELQGILASEKKLLAVIKRELLAVRKQHADPRRTLIVREAQALEIADGEDTAAEESVVLITRAGMLKRLSPKAWEKRAFEDARDADLPLFVLPTWTNRKLLYFTNQGTCFALPVTDVPECRLSERGAPPGGLLAGLESGETVVSLLDLDPAEESALDPCLLLFTKAGQVKRTALGEFAVRTKRYAALALKSGDELLAVARTTPRQGPAPACCVLVSRKGMSIAFDPSDVPVQGRAAGGVKGMALDPADRVAFAHLAPDAGELLVFSDRGYAKRVILADIEPQARGGKGQRLWTFGKNKADGAVLVAACVVQEPLDLLVLQKDGRSPLSSEAVPIAARAERGVPIVMALMENTVQDVIAAP